MRIAPLNLWMKTLSLVSREERKTQKIRNMMRQLMNSQKPSNFTRNTQKPTLKED
jgi:hypothetical protein